jgi:hypothetical protein
MKNGADRICAIFHFAAFFWSTVALNFSANPANLPFDNPAGDCPARRAVGQRNEGCSA